jgi:hypothetical protein
MFSRRLPRPSVRPSSRDERLRSGLNSTEHVVWVLKGYWYPRLTALQEASLNSNFVFGTGWWAESGA